MAPSSRRIYGPSLNPRVSNSYAIYLICTGILNARSVWTVLQSVLKAEKDFGKACNFVFQGRCDGYIEDLKLARPETAGMRKTGV